VIIIVLIERNLVQCFKIQDSLCHERSENFWQYLMIFLDLDHSERISSQFVQDTNAIRNDHSERISFSQVQVRMNSWIAEVFNSSSLDLDHHKKIQSQHVQETIHDTLFDFSISARTISMRTTMICSESDSQNISNFWNSWSSFLSLKNWIFSTREAVVRSILFDSSQKESESIRIDHIYIFLSR
jgi:hypothetical protein